MVDKATVKDRLCRITRSIDRLSRLAQVDRETFLEADSDLPAIAESHLRKSLEAVFDIGRHLLAKQGRPDLAREYKSIALGLAEMGIVPSELQDKLVKMAGYRNRLVHFYHEVSNEELFDVITHNLDDLRAFVRSIAAYLKTL